MKRGTEKIGILLVSFAVFVAGVWALYRAHGTQRTVLLWICFVLLAAIALYQTLKKRTK